MSLKRFPIIIDSNLYVKTWKDDLYNELNNYMYNTGIYKDLTDDASLTRKIGRGERANNKYEELFYYKILIDYLINMKEAISKSGLEDVDIEIESFKLDKIRANLLCRFNSAKLFDNLISLLNVDASGIDYMMIGSITETIGDELTNDPTFTIDGIWYEAGHSPITRNGGTLVISSLSGANVSTDFILVVGKSYLVEITLDSIGSGNIQLFSGEPAGALLTVTTPGTYSVIATKTTSFNFFVLATPLFSGATISLFSVKEYSATESIVTDNPFIIE